MPIFSFSQTAQESQVLNVVNQLRVKTNLTGVNINQSYYASLTKFIEAHAPIDTTKKAITQTIEKINSYLETMYADQSTFVNYGAAVVDPANRATPEDLLIKIEKTVEQPLSKMYDLTSIMPKVWECTVLNKRILFVYIVGFN